MRRKNTSKEAISSFESKRLKQKSKSEDKELKASIKEINNNIRITNKKRRELGRQITFAPMDELIPIKKAINKGEDGFQYRDNLGFFDIVRIVSFDYSAMDDEELAKHIFHWGRFYLVTANPLKRVSLNMPVDTTQQIGYYKKLLQHTDDPLKRQKIKNEIMELESFDDRQTRDYFLFYYANDLDSLRNEYAQIKASLEEKGYAIRLSPIRKLQVLNKLSNPYSYKEMLTENFT